MKLPPYGRELKARRDAGEHPLRVYVAYGKDGWRHRRTDASGLCVDDGYEPGQFDWSVLAGLPVTVEWLDGERIYDLVAEIALHAAPVLVITPRHRWTASAFLCEGPDSFRSPLWSVEAERDYLDREAAYDLAQLQDLMSATDGG